MNRFSAYLQRSGEAPPTQSLPEVIVILFDFLAVTLTCLELCLFADALSMSESGTFDRLT
jgi:hypothetical protein